jgi:DNA-binding protein H-NS
LPLIDSPDNWIVPNVQLKDDAMRKHRDYDAELKALDGKAKALKVRRLEQLGQLVMATGADTLPIEQLAGALLIATEQKDAAAMEAQRARGAAFFQATKRAGRGASGHGQNSTSNGGTTPSPVASDCAP